MDQTEAETVRRAVMLNVSQYYHCSEDNGHQLGEIDRMLILFIYANTVTSEGKLKCASICKSYGSLWMFKFYILVQATSNLYTIRSATKNSV
jgi:hypothetical protein